MTLEQLRIFVAVAEQEHVTRAAEVLNLTQSAVSTAIRALEGRHAVDLFHRVGRRIELTPAGRLFLGEAKAVLARANAAALTLSELAGLTRGSLSVQASQTIASYWLPRHLVRFRQRYPGVEIQLGIGNTAQVARAVLEGRAELGFVEGAVDEPALGQRQVGRDRLVMVVGARHPWAGRGYFPPDDLGEAPWVLREPGSGTRSELEAALARMGLGARVAPVVLELPSNEAVRAAVEAGAGITALSELVAEAGLRTGTLRRLGFDLPERDFHALSHRERRCSRAAQALIAEIDAASAQQGSARITEPGAPA